MRILFIQLSVDDKKYTIIAGIGEKMWKTHLSSGKLKSPQNLHKNFLSKYCNRQLQTCQVLFADSIKILMCGASSRLEPIIAQCNH